MEMVGQRIRKLRKDNNWTQPQLASKVNVSPQVISNWERGYTRPNADDVARLAKVFNVKADYILFGRSDDPSHSEKKERPDPITNVFFREWDKADEEKKKRTLEFLKFLNQMDDEENIKK